MNGNYLLYTRVKNSGREVGRCVGYDNNSSINKNIFLDRENTESSTNYVYWNFTLSTSTKSNVRYEGESGNHNESIKTYIINHKGDNNRYMGLSGKNLVTSSTSTKWIIVSEEDFKSAMDNVTWGKVDLGSFLKDADFGRDNMDARYWVWSNAESPAVIETGEDSEHQEITLDNYVLGTNAHWHQRNQNVMCNGYTGNISGRYVGTNISGVNNNSSYSHDAFVATFAQYYAAEIYKEKITLSQSVQMSGVQNLVEGLYKLTIQALYDDDVSHKTNNGVSWLFVQVETDGEIKYQELPITPIGVNNAYGVNGSSVTPHSGVSAGYLFDTNEYAGYHEFYIELKSNSHLTIGIRTDDDEGWTVFGNVHLYAHGKQALFLDEDWTTDTTIPYYEGDNPRVYTGDPYRHTQFYGKYDFPATVYYNRTMTTGEWNTIVLPFNLTGTQVRQTFGNDCLVSEFEGMDSKDASVIKFTATKNLFTEGMKANVPYIIKPTRDPDVALGKTEKLLVGNGGEHHYIEIDGPVYYIPGVTKDAVGTLEVDPQTGIESYTGPMPAPQVVTCPNSKLAFTGSYYKKVLSTSDINGRENPSGAHNYWVINKGKMYHLTGSQPYNIWGTYCYIYDPEDTFKYSSAGSKKISIRIEGVEDLDEQVTAIEGLYIENVTNYDVYNMSGQKVAENAQLDALPKGVYIVNGKKYVVK